MDRRRRRRIKVAVIDLMDAPQVKITFFCHFLSIYQTDVDIQWVVMTSETEVKQSDCESERDFDALAAKGKKQIVCMEIPVVIRNKTRRRNFGVRRIEEYHVTFRPCKNLLVSQPL